MQAIQEKSVQVVRYLPAHREIWNRFNQQAINGLFLFDRTYLEYHQHRFRDHSLLFFQEGQLICILPMNEAEGAAISHQGLTFGGLIIGLRMKIHTYLRTFDTLLNYLRLGGFTKFIYKPVPFIFQQSLALDDQYALFQHGFRLKNRSLSSCIDLSLPLHYTKGRKWSLTKARQAGLAITGTQDFKTFMNLVGQILENKYAVQPTHTAEEIIYLAGQFPQHIKLLAVYHNHEMIGGSIIYLSSQVVHLQYIATSEAGKKLHALDLIINHLINTYREDKKYLNFGISPGPDAYGLSTGLIQNKESYGARSLPHDIYELNF
ncbi:MAG: hypothetical protein JWQ14_3449 [Adhaeribacter sp.]|nr:hypothetical protein [Adhaeribacter sp.]